MRENAILSNKQATKPQERAKEKMSSSSPQELCAEKLGPWGGPGGTQWDDGIHDGVKKIKISATDHAEVIESIQVTYIKDGHEVVAPRHGGSGGHKYPEIVLHEGEKIISLGGTVGTYKGSTDLVKSLVITTNKHVHGPYGEFKLNQETKSLFFVDLSKVTVVGFFGRSGAYLDSLGIHVEAH